MNNLFIIDGAPATGKTTFINHVRTKYATEGNIIKKYTTRDKRKEELELKDTDLIFIKPNEDEDGFIKECYSYKYGCNEYFLNLNELNTSIENYKNSFLILRDSTLIEYLIDKYCDDLLIIPILICTKKKYAINRLKKQGYSYVEAIRRIERKNALTYDNIGNVHLYREVIINDYDYIHFINSIDYIIKKYN